MINEYNKQDIAQKLNDGKLLAVEKKKDDLFVVGGGNKGKKGKKQKTQQKEASDKFQIDFTIINKFGLVRISPPSAPSGLDAKIEEIVQNQKDFKAAGEKKLKDIKDNMGQHIADEVEEDIKREEREKEYLDEEEK